MSQALTVRMYSLFLSSTFQGVLLWTFSKNPSRILPAWGALFSPALRGGWITLVEQGSPCVLTPSGTACAGLLPVWSVWTGPGPRWRRCWIQAGRWSGRPRHSGGSPAGRCRCSAPPAPSARWSGTWGQAKPWGKTSCTPPNHAASSHLHPCQCLFN